MKKFIPILLVAAVAGSLFIQPSAQASSVTSVKHAKKHHKKHHHHHHKKVS